MKLAPNFRLDEFMQLFKGRYALFSPHAVEQLQSIRDEIAGAITITSGYRNVTYNASVGGATSSRHMYGDAADMHVTVVSYSRLATECTERGAGYIEVLENHVHCDWRDTPLEPAFYWAGAARALVAFSSRGAVEIVYEGDLVPGSPWTAPAVGWTEGEPLREWWAFDAEGRQLAHEFGDHFWPPDGATYVEVEVGAIITLQESVPRR